MPWYRDSVNSPVNNILLYRKEMGGGIIPGKTEDNNLYAAVEGTTVWSTNIG